MAVLRKEDDAGIRACRDRLAGLPQERQQSAFLGRDAGPTAPGKTFRSGHHSGMGLLLDIKK